MSGSAEDTSDADAGLSAGQESDLLGEAVARMLRGVVTPSGTIGLEPSGIDRAAWRRLREMGLIGPDAAALSLADQAGIAHCLGYAAALVPYAESEAMARWLAHAAGFATSPDETLTLAVVGPAPLNPALGQAGAIPLGRQTLPWSRDAGRAVLSFSTSTGHFVALVPAAALRPEPGINLAGYAWGRCTAERVSLAATDLREVGNELSSAAVMRRGALLRSAAILGASLRANELTLQYALDRRQFGRPLGHFQVIQSYLAQMAGELSAASAMLETALAAAESHGDNTAEAAACKIRVGQAASVIAALAHQIHGAIGYTQEYPLHLWTRRLWAWREEYGNEAFWARELGATMIRLGADSYWARITR